MVQWLSDQTRDLTGCMFDAGLLHHWEFQPSVRKLGYKPSYAWYDQPCVCY